MGDKSGIEWTDATWNPVVGCTRVSAGCDLTCSPIVAVHETARTARPIEHIKRSAAAAGTEYAGVRLSWIAQSLCRLSMMCGAAGVAFHFKQWGGRTAKAGGRLLDGRTWDEYPEGGAS